MTRKIKICIADDQPLTRDGVAAILKEFKDYHIIGKAENGEEVVVACKKGDIPDIIILDLNMPKMDGMQTAKWLHENHPAVKILILTMFEPDLVLVALLKLGIKGMLKKDLSTGELKLALDEIYAGNMYFGKDITGKMAMEKREFTDKEIAFLKLVATDMPYKEIAVTLNMGFRQIDLMRENMFKKTGVNSRVGLAIYALNNGIVTY